jgi:hypothetical protein
MDGDEGFACFSVCSHFFRTPAGVDILFVIGRLWSRFFVASPGVLRFFGAFF